MKVSHFTFWTIVVLGATLQGVFGAPSPIRAEDTDQGSLVFSESAHDFGTVYRGEKLQAQFNFTNVGKGSLTVQGVHAACGCTAVEVERGRKYKPGESGVVTVKLDTTDFAGPLMKAVVVMSSEKLTPDRTLTIKAFIKSEIEADPPLVDFGDVLAKDGASKAVHIKPIDNFKLALKDLTYNQDLFTVTLIPGKEAKDGWLMTVQLKPNLAPGFLKEQIIVKNNSQHLRDMPVPVRAQVKGDIQISPQYLEFGAVGPDEKVRKSVALQSASDFEVKTSRAEVSVNGKRVEGGEKIVTISLVPGGKSGQQATVEVLNPKGMAGSVHGKVYFQTNSPSQAELAVDFYAVFR